MRTLLTRCVIGLWLACALFSTSARAAESKPEDNRRIVEGYLHAAKAAYTRRNYSRAAEKWRLAYRRWPEPALLFNRGQALRLAGEREEALTVYGQYLKELPQAPNRDEVARFMAELKKPAGKASDGGE